MQRLLLRVLRFFQLCCVLASLAAVAASTRAQTRTDAAAARAAFGVSLAATQACSVALLTVHLATLRLVSASLDAALVVGIHAALLRQCGCDEALEPLWRLGRAAATQALRRWYNDGWRSRERPQRRSRGRGRMETLPRHMRRNLRRRAARGNIA